MTVKPENALQRTRKLPPQSRHSDLTLEGGRMAKIKGPRKVQRYTAEFKLKAVKLTRLWAFASVVGVPSVELVPCVGPAPHLPCSLTLALRWLTPTRCRL